MIVRINDIVRDVLGTEEDGSIMLRSSEELPSPVEAIIDGRPTMVELEYKTVVYTVFGPRYIYRMTFVHR